jgi:hypothetical protein
MTTPINLTQLRTNINETTRRSQDNTTAVAIPADWALALIDTAEAAINLINKQGMGTANAEHHLRETLNHYTTTVTINPNTATPTNPPLTPDNHPDLAP